MALIRALTEMGPMIWPMPEVGEIAVHSPPAAVAKARTQLIWREDHISTALTSMRATLRRAGS